MHDNSERVGAAYLGRGEGGMYRGSKAGRIPYSPFHVSIFHKGILTHRPFQSDLILRN